MTQPVTSKKIEKLTAVKGMNDVLPPHSATLEWFEASIRTLMRQYAYRNIRTPIVERTPLFIRGLGEVTDIVEKEMYCFEDRLNGDSLTLRPEATAGVVRAAIEHNLLYDGGKRLYYMGPMFRHERPQKGRYRQFDQIGAEALGFSGPEVDAELILMANALWKKIGLMDVQLELNSLGQPAERLEHRKALIAYLEQHEDKLDEDAKRRLYSNPLRILDTKNPQLQDIVNAAPRLMDFLGADSLMHFNTLTSILETNGVAFTVNPRLVRGMDYYNLTVFEFTTNRLGSQGTVCAGGRYDYLFDQLGGKPTPAVGWALGVDRVLELVKSGGERAVEPVLDVFVIVTEATAFPFVMKQIAMLRDLGLSVQMHAHSATGLGSMKSQFKRADSSGARFVLVFAADEMAAEQVTIKPMRDASLAQQTVPVQHLPIWARTLQSLD